MYTSFLKRDKNKKKDTKHSNLRSTSSVSSSVSPYVSSSSGPINVYRSTSHPSGHLVPYSGAQSLSISNSTDHPSSSSHAFPRPINSPLPNVGAYSRYSYSRTDQQLSPLAQGDYFQHNHEQLNVEHCAFSSPQQAAGIVSHLLTFTARVNHRSKQYGSSCINERLQLVADKYKIRDTLTQRLCMLEQFDIVVLCDDSSSMNTPIEGTHSTRWNELQTIVQIIIEISVVLDSNGIDVYFLNRDAVFDVTDPRQIYQSFAKRPIGATPLVPALRQIFRSAASKLNRNKRLLVFVATDAEPTDASGNVDIRSLERLMQTERQSDNMHVAFLTCTHNKSSVAYLSVWDRTMINIDVIDTYETEREEVRQMRGYQFPFSFGDYIAKALLGAVDPQMDLLDEPANNN